MAERVVAVEASIQVLAEIASLFEKPFQIGNDLRADSTASWIAGVCAPPIGDDEVVAFLHGLAPPEGQGQESTPLRPRLESPGSPRRGAAAEVLGSAAPGWPRVRAIP